MAPSKESFRLSTQDASFLYGEAANAPLSMASECGQTQNFNLERGGT